MLSTADGGIAQFFDRDAPAEMAKVGMEGFQQFMVSLTTSTRSLSGSKKPASASTSKLHDRAANNPPPGHFGRPDNRAWADRSLRPSPAHSGGQP
jgi:hypothetical protein